MHTGNISEEYLHEVVPLSPADQFCLEGLSKLIKIDRIANVYCRVRSIVFDTDEEVKARFASHEYLGADALYDYFIVPVYPNSLMSEGLLLLVLGKLCKQHGWRVVLDESENGVRPTLKYLCAFYQKWGRFAATRSSFPSDFSFNCCNSPIHFMNFELSMSCMHSILALVSTSG